MSPPKPVNIYVESLYPNWLTDFFKFFNAGGWIAFAVLGLGSAIFAGVRIQRSLQRRSELGDIPEGDFTTVDPLIQSVPGLAVEENNHQEDPYRRPVYATSDELKPKPHFKQVGGSPFPVKANLSITTEIKIIGSDAENAAILLDHPSVSPQHARVRVTVNGSVGIADMRSSTGTWVNYAPVSSKGTILKNGDLVKIGAFTFHYHLGFNGGRS